MSNKTREEVLNIFEDRFKRLTGYKGRFDHYPLMKHELDRFDTDKDKSRSFAEVFTPLYIVDEMIGTVENVGGMDQGNKYLDFCAGHGQFSIRILRMLYEKHGEEFDIGRYLKQKHYFCELQTSSCYKLLWTFSSKINLAIGDALQLGILPKKARGIWAYLESIDSWIDVSNFTRALFAKTGMGKNYSEEKEQEFVRIYDSFIGFLNGITEEKNMLSNIKQIIATKEGRQKFLEIINEASDGVEQNWQDKATPEWVVREMVNTIPGGVESLKKILVLFNVEFLECLVKEKGVDPRRITFGYDSELEGLYATTAYKVNTMSIGKSFEELVQATEGLAGKFDVVFSNPPYQIQSDAQKGREGGGSRQAKPIYHEIVMHAIDNIQPRYISMITPSRWMVGGMGLGAYRQRMLDDKRIRLIQDFPGEKDVFPTVMIKGGVSYFLWDKEHCGDCEFNGYKRPLNEFDIVVRDNTSVSILKKVLAKHPAGQFCDQKVLPNKPFGLPTNFNEWVPEGTPGAVRCFAMRQEEKWVHKDAFMDEHNVLSKHKVCIARARSQGITDAEGEGRPSPVTGYTFQIGPNEICIETYIVIGAFSNKREANNYEEYVKTKFFRFCLMQRLISQDVNKAKFAWVPDLGDYSKAWTDQELYQHFGLTKKEIDHIEKTIKELK